MGNLLDWLIEHETAFKKSRLPSLYSDLSVQKTTNPEGYATNVNAWQTALNNAASAGQLPNEKSLILHSSDELLSSLSSSQYGRPTGLGLVLDKAVQTGEMIDTTTFLHSDASIYERSWIPKPMAILKWGLKQTGLVSSRSYDVSGRLRDGQLVLVPALESLCKRITTAQERKSSGLVDRITTKEAFVKEMNEFAASKLTNQEVAIMLRFLSRDKQLISFDDQTVKFKSPAATLPEPITSNDASIASMKSLMSSLELQTSALEARIEALQAKATAAVKTKNKQLAMSALRSKKLAENTLQQRTANLHQLEEVFSKIEQAVDQVEIMNAMEASTTILKTLNKQIGGVDRVEGIMDDLREQVDEVNEVGQVIQEPLNNQTMLLDEAELDNELELMEREETQARKKEANATAVRRLQELDALAFDKRDQEREQERKLKSSIEQLERMNIGQDGEQARTTEAVTESST